MCPYVRERMALKLTVLFSYPLVSVRMSYAHFLCLLSWILHLNFSTVEIMAYSFSAKLGPSSLCHLLGSTSGLPGIVDPLRYNCSSHSSQLWTSLNSK